MPDTDQTNTCPDCGTTYPSGDFGGMCPGCLLLGLGDEGEDGAPQLPDLAGTRIGRYLLVKKLGEGGMGSVWKAKQDEPVEREVALKLIKPGMDTRAVLARFEAERQVLATLDHSNIAKIFDAGATENGRPYYVMELVDGLPITDYCEQHQLTTEERLALFGNVCKAVQHAHDQGVVHRDLKPSNILVSSHQSPDHSGEARLKVIDFGIAKAAGSNFAEETLMTREGQIVGTPGYMSPEQADGNAEIDGRADVYSLGALLYEMLSGTPPFTGQSLHDAGLLEVIRIIKEEEPPKPSTRLTTAAAGSQGPRVKIASDLDWIALKALAKDPAQRYASPAALFEDIGRHQRRQPVSATAPSLATHLGKFVLRHRNSCITAAVAALAIITTFVVSRSLAPDPAAAAEEAEPIDLSPGPEFNLWKLLDPEKDANLPGTFRIDGDSLVFTDKTSKKKSITVPIVPQQSYRLTFKVSTSHSTQSEIFLPAGDRLARVGLSRGGKIILEKGVIGKPWSNPELALADLRPGEHQLVLTVVRDPDSGATTISVAAGERELIEWSGEPGELGDPPDEPVSGIDIRFGKDAPPAYHSLKLQPLGPRSGVRLARPEDLDQLDSPAARDRLRHSAARGLLEQLGPRIDLVEDGEARSIYYPDEVPDGPFEVQRIDWGRATFTPQQIPNLLTFDEWQFVMINRSITDPQLALLGRLEKLQSLVLCRPMISVEGLHALTGFPALRSLRIAYCRSLRGTLDLSNLPGLEVLELLYCDNIDDITRLGANPNLEKLYLFGTAVGDAGIAFSVTPPALERVEFRHCKMTAAALDQFARIPTLNRLQIDDLIVTRETAVAFQEKLPGCKITFRSEGERVVLEPR